ncbi:MAG: PorP/SprF family type IX secretion system membrane protein [Flavobacteriales bacterium]
MIVRLYIFFFMLKACLVFGQDPSFSQFFQKNPYVNPAYTGILGGQEIHSIFHHRSQWTNVPIKFTTSLSSVDWRVCQKNLGIGIIVLQNIEGEGLLKLNEFSLPIAAHVPLSKNYSLSGSIQTTFANRTIEWDRLIFSDELDPILGNIYNSSATKPNESFLRIYPSAGFILTKKGKYNLKRHNYWTIGIAAHHIPIGNNTESFYGIYENSRYPVKYTIHGNLFTKIMPFKRFKTGALIGDFFDYTNVFFKLENQGKIEAQSESFTTISSGLGVSMRKFLMLGVGYRQGFVKLKNQQGNNFERRLMSESIIFNSVFNIQAKNIPYKLYITYSLDLNISELSYTSSGPTHEISLNMYFGNIKCKTKRKKRKSHWWSDSVMDQKRLYNREICDPFPKISDWDGY